MNTAGNKKILNLKPVEMREDVMRMLEDKGLIIRLCPGNHEPEAAEGSFAVETIYASGEAYGPHKLIVVTINSDTVANFGSHPENEEFIFIGDSSAKKLYLIVSLIKKDELNEKIKSGTVSEEDFIALGIRFNDASVSFFTMLKDVPHGEISVAGAGKPASFYVTESRDLMTDNTDMSSFDFKLAF